MSLQILMPTDFKPDDKYLTFLGSVLDKYVGRFGGLSFSTLQVGAIKRGDDSEINGSPSGDLILFSRTALGAPLSVKGAHPDGGAIDLSDATRRMVIAHELSHLWFGEKYLGSEGWMVEGIPQYLGILESVKSVSNEEGRALISFFTKIAKSGPEKPIPSASAFSTPDDIRLSYYCAPLALYAVGEKIGHDQLISLITDVYGKRAQPVFADFDSAFKSKYPQYSNDWNVLWHLPQPAANGISSSNHG